MIWCLHGAVGMASDWESFAAEMEMEGHEVRAVDLWQFQEERVMSLEDFGTAAFEEMVRDDPEPVLLGYSMGGRLALHALLANPAKWKAGIIVSAHPGLSEERDRILRMADDAGWAASALTGDWAAFLRNWNDQPALRESGDEGLADRTSLEARREAVARGFMGWSLGKQGELRGRLGEIECPVLWMTGEKDAKFTGLGAEAAPLLGLGRHCSIPRAGHRVPWEAREPFRAEVLRFLGGL